MSDTTTTTTTITAEERAAIRKVFGGNNYDAGNTMIRMLDALEQAEANVARLTKMVDWLGEKCAMYADETDYLHSPHRYVADYWTEAARRAVADAESEVKG